LNTLKIVCWFPPLYGASGNSLAEGFEGNMNYISEKNSHINKKINSLFGTNAYLYRIHSSGKKNKTQYSIAVDPMKIELNW